MRSAVGAAAAPALPLLLVLSACAAREETLPRRVTFSEHVAPILYAHCASCHRPGEGAPFPLLSYADARRRARQIAAVTRKRSMPPWLPEPSDPPFVGERRLTPQEIDVLARWHDEGAPEGDPARLPVLPTWPAGWRLGEPDLVVEPEAAYVLVADAREDVFRNLVIPIPVDRPRWVRAVELQPGNKRIVHHAILQVDRTPASRALDAQDTEVGFGGMSMGDSIPPDGHFLGWTPGRSPEPGSDGLTWRLDRGTDLVLQLHLLPTGKPEPIRPRVGFFFGDAPPVRRPFIVALGQRGLDIPPGEKRYVVTDEIELPIAVDLIGLYPHAHYLAKTMDVTATLPDGTARPLLRILDWNFSWQDEYRYERPIPLPRGTKIAMRYSYDNSAGNERNRNDPPIRVVSGNRSIDEMATLAVQVVVDTVAQCAVLEEAQSRHVLAKDPGDFAGHNNLGNALLAQGRTEEALEQLRRAVDIRPDSSEARYNLGVAYSTLGRYEEAAHSYREALARNPVSAHAENNLGNALAELGRPAEAIARYERAIELEPDFDEALYNLGNALLRLERYAEAAERFRLALRVDPGHAMTHNNLAVALEAQGKTAEAVAAFKRALELDPDLEEARANLTRALAKSPPPS